LRIKLDHGPGHTSPSPARLLSSAHLHLIPNRQHPPAGRWPCRSHIPPVPSLWACPFFFIPAGGRCRRNELRDGPHYVVLVLAASRRRACSGIRAESTHLASSGRSPAKGAVGDGPRRCCELVLGKIQMKKKEKEKGGGAELGLGE
jgi:hypothetical protein